MKHIPVSAVELKAEYAGGVLKTAEAQTAGSESHPINSSLWRLKEAEAAGLTEVDLMQETVSFSTMSSHTQALAYLHWLDSIENVSLRLTSDHTGRRQSRV